jgi:hypothetical protein
MADPRPGPALPQLGPFVAYRQVAVTPSDATVLNFSALYVGVTGDVVIQPFAGDATVTYHAYPGGSWLPAAGVKVMAATTAADILAVS